jgi:hypothetical protein
MVSIVVVGILVISALVVASLPWIRTARDRRIALPPTPAHWEQVLIDGVALYRRMPPELRPALHTRMQFFLRHVRFEGCAGVEVTERMRLIVSAQAGLLVVQRPGLRPYPDLKTVLIYPRPFVPVRATDDGIESPLEPFEEHPGALSGESWTHDAVILSWECVERESRGDYPGQNIVIHEFAHQLDQEDGEANGAPLLSSRNRYATWARVLSHHFTRLRRDLEDGHDALLPEDAADDPAEFFAVATEAFFESPHDLQALAPDLYLELRTFYRLDPAAWS